MSDTTVKWNSVDANLVWELQELAALRFGSRVDRSRLDRAVSEAAVELMSQPARVTSYFPDLAVNQVSRSLSH